MKRAAAVNPAQHIQRQPLEGMALTNDGYLLGISSEVVVGSLSSGSWPWSITHAADCRRRKPRWRSCRRSTVTPAPCGIRGRVYAQWAETTAALNWLAKAEQMRDSGVLELKVDRLLDPIRNEPQFKALERRLNFPP